ncbi:hypothetical protein GUJ93_ZPchr0011g28205 [Zizania palustris]|uniref:Trichome birefringence-like C-terminal domain-containing protein n=1 Tax=Zizania palustris TaxID=103762 RepID=A0A8J5WL68_ZIZPA|nr:hypothetical protein GUJ93_ZPchr0011g28205 [Zizania palustris]
MNTRDMKVMRLGGLSWEEHDKVIRIKAYRKVLTTWARWVNENVDPTLTSIFFMSISPLHIRADFGPVEEVHGPGPMVEGGQGLGIQTSAEDTAQSAADCHESRVLTPPSPRIQSSSSSLD